MKGALVTQSVTEHKQTTGQIKPSSQREENNPPRYGYEGETMSFEQVRKVVLYTLLAILLLGVLSGCGPQGNSVMTTVQKESYTFKDDGNVLPRKLEVPSEDLTKGLNLPKNVGWNTVVSGDCVCQTLTTNSRGDLLADKVVDCNAIKAGTKQLYQVSQGKPADPAAQPAACTISFEIPEFVRSTTTKK